MNRAVANLPSLDLVVARRFYCDLLGFQVIFDTSEGGREGLVGLERDGMRINIDAPMDGHGRQACVSLEVDDVAALHAEWAAHLPGLEPPADQPWGARTFGFQDPDDNTVFVLGPITTA
ncbi:MAG: VOC family protein [Fimbriimonadaceae bacterium]|nr:VOC family protein [Fimbriimonadaceae bacterium]